MGKHKDDHTGFENVTQAQVNEALQPHADLPPQSPDLKNAQALLGKAVRALVGAHMTTVILTDVEGDSYHGLAIRCRSMDTNDTVPHFEAVHGLRKYPDARPDYAFQFIAPGEDESVLINIANAFVRVTHDQTPSPDAGDVSSGNQ